MEVDACRCKGWGCLWVAKAPLLCASYQLPPAPTCLPPHPPARIARFYMQPRAERKATYSRWWGIVKKEAKHYWVRRLRLAGGHGMPCCCGRALPIVLKRACWAVRLYCNT